MCSSSVLSSRGHKGTDLHKEQKIGLRRASDRGGGKGPTNLPQWALAWVLRHEHSETVRPLQRC